jgi:hypothetical protein
MKLNGHSKKRLLERHITFDLIHDVIDQPDEITKESKQRVLYKKVLNNGRTLGVVIRKNSMLITAYWGKNWGKNWENEKSHHIEEK